MNGYTALRQGAAWLDFEARGRFWAAGEDRARLLHAMTTNHVQSLAPGQGCYAFFLNAQGRILGDVHLLCCEDRFLLDTEPETHDLLFQHLDKYIIADDVTLEDARADLTVIAIEGPRSGVVIEQLGLPAPERDHDHVQQGQFRVARISSTGQPGFRLYLERQARPAILAQLEAAGVVQATADEQRIVRLENRKPRYGEDITDRNLVQETRQLQAVHFSKGCYLGQEIVERVRSRGQVHRLLSALTVEGSDPVDRGTAVRAGDTAVGEITSAAFSPALGKTVALGYLRSEHATPKTRLSLDGRQVEVVGECGGA
ncbi:MAG: hypothetical protein NZV14_02365 [Bryobacteraceae bacterium]|nr:hypothetical protein [Bryobacteraceae bacterium]MDW8376975.1 glycine cleavage T C-terminal barrel domain-containing protein [Bryobacterales bacterium]